MSDEKNRKVVIELRNVKRYFQVGSETVKALRGVSFKIYEGEFVTIQGTSGSGKSTLLNQLGCLDTPTSGEYFLDGISVRTMSKTQRAHLRNRKIGFVFQNYNLLAKTTAVENVELPLMYNSEVSAKERREKAVRALKAVGLGDRLEHKSNQMSGGQMQRVAIARALVKAGEYTAVRVMIGQAKGHNWWCVMFPPLCLSAAEEEPDAAESLCLEDVLSGEEMDFVEGGGYEPRFKCVELYEAFKKRCGTGNLS